jgi:hypothetical protein
VGPNGAKKASTGASSQKSIDGMLENRKAAIPVAEKSIEKAVFSIAVLSIFVGITLPQQKKQGAAPWSRSM